jgi:predicted transcriptional regulator
MPFIIQKITVVRTQKPQFNTVNDELQWLAGSLGLFNLRDKDKTCFRVFIELIKQSKEADLISSDELAARLQLTRGTVVHHLNKLLEAGLIINNRNRYELRVSSLEALVDMIQADFEKTCNELRRVAQNLDIQLGLK